MYWLPTITLMLASPFLAEVLTGSAPVMVFFTPIVFILFVTVGYGIPVLIIRELYVRYSLGLVSLLVLGFAYGVVNEGLFAQTIFHPFHAPIPQLALYGLVENIRIPFLLVISTWHALYAVVFPILLVHWLFPKVAKIAWVPKKVLWGVGLLSFAFGTLGFFINERASEFPGFPEGLTGNSAHYVFMLFLWLGCAVVAWALMKVRFLPAPLLSKWLTAVLAGALFIAVVIIPTVLASIPIPLPFFYTYFAAVALAGAYLLVRVESSPERIRLSFLWGGEIALAMFGFLMALFLLVNPVQAVVVGGFLLLFIYLLVRSRVSE